MKKCEGCRYWSELMARSNATCTGVEAMCLNSHSFKYGEYTIYREDCDLYSPGCPVDMLDYGGSAL